MNHLRCRTAWPLALILCALAASVGGCRDGDGDRVRVTCTYDTRKATAAVLPGWGTGDEMCLLGAFMVPAAE